MPEASVAQLVDRREPDKRATPAPEETKTHAGGEAPLGRPGEQWRVVHDVADRRADTFRRRVRGAFREARDRLSDDDLLPALERRDVDAVMEQVPTVADTDLPDQVRGLLSDMLAEVARDTARRLAADTIEAVADKALPALERKQDEDDLPFGSAVPESVSSVEGFRRFLEQIGFSMSPDLSRRVGVLLSFDATNPRAVEFARSRAAEMVTEVSEETRRAIRSRVVAAFDRGFPPDRLAREIRDVGIGLTRRQSAAVDNFREALESGDPATIRQQTQRRLSAVQQQQLRSAAASGQVSQELRDELVGRYAESMRNRRALNIARTETINASTAGQQKLWEEAIDQEVLDADRSRKIWIVTPDSRLCDTCSPIPALNDTGVPVNEAFETPVGDLMGPTAHPSCRCGTGLNFVQGDAVRREAA